MNAPVRWDLGAADAPDTAKRNSCEPARRPEVVIGEVPYGLAGRSIRVVVTGKGAHIVVHLVRLSIDGSPLFGFSLPERTIAPLVGMLCRAQGEIERLRAATAPGTREAFGPSPFARDGEVVVHETRCESERAGVVVQVLADERFGAGARASRFVRILAVRDSTVRSIITVPRRLVGNVTEALARARGLVEGGR